MSARTRHAAELGARLERQNANKYAHALAESPNPTPARNPGQIAQDVDKLLRLAASLRGWDLKQPKCKGCDGFGKIAVPAAQPPHTTVENCGYCDGTGKDEVRRSGMIQAVTDTLKAYGLTWKDAGVPEGRVSILFPGYGQGGWRV